MSNNIEWLNQNEGRAYPLKEDTSLVDATGNVTLPNNIIVDFVLVAPADLELTLYLTRVQLSTDLLTLIFSDAFGVTVTSLIVDLDAHTDGAGYKLNGQNAYDDAVGRIAIGNLSDIQQDMPQGQFDFTAELETCVVRPDIRGVRALRVINADGSQSDPIYGTVLFKAGLNMRLTYVPGAEPAIRFDSLATDLEEDCDCNSALLKPAPITSINGVAPDGTGNIDIQTPGGCTNMSGGEGQLTLEDDCAQPCCGCDELEQITDTLAIVQQTVERLEEFNEQLKINQEDFSTKVLRSIV